MQHIRQIDARCVSGQVTSNNCCLYSIVLTSESVDIKFMSETEDGVVIIYILAVEKEEKDLPRKSIKSFEIDDDNIYFRNSNTRNRGHELFLRTPAEAELDVAKKRGSGILHDFAICTPRCCMLHGCTIDLPHKCRTVAMPHHEV